MALSRMHREDGQIFSSNVFRNYSDAAHSCIGYGLVEANTLGLTEFGTEALLLGLVLCEEGKASQILLKVVDHETLREQIAKTAVTGQPTIGKVVELPFSRGCTEILKDKVHAVALKSTVTTTDLLLAILNDPESGAVRLLASLQVDLHNLRALISTSRSQGDSIPHVSNTKMMIDC